MDKKTSDKETPPMSFVPPGTAPLPPGTDFTYPFYNFAGGDMSGAAAFSGASAQAFAAVQQAQALAAANYYARLQQPQLPSMAFMPNASAAAQMNAMQQQQQQQLQQPWMWMPQANVPQPPAQSKPMAGMPPQFGAMPPMTMMASPYAVPPYALPPTTAPPPFGAVSFTPPAAGANSNNASGHAGPARTPAGADAAAAPPVALTSPVPLPPSAASLAATSTPAVPAMVSVECSMLSLAPNVQLPSGTPFCPPGVPPPAEYVNPASAACRQPKLAPVSAGTAIEEATAGDATAAAGSADRVAPGSADTLGAASSPPAGAVAADASNTASARTKEDGSPANTMNFLGHAPAASAAAGEVAAFSAFGVPSAAIPVTASQQTAPTASLAVGGGGGPTAAPESAS